VKLSLIFADAVLFMNGRARDESEDEAWLEEKFSFSGDVSSSLWLYPSSFFDTDIAIPGPAAPSSDFVGLPRGWGDSSLFNIEEKGAADGTSTFTSPDEKCEESRELENDGLCPP
jgi:hypothetical protein